MFIACQFLSKIVDLFVVVLSLYIMAVLIVTYMH